MNKSRILIVGALGTVGRSALEFFESLPDWDVVAISRRKPDFPTRAEWLSVDLGADSAPSLLREGGLLRGVTQVMYTALYEKEDNVVAHWVNPEHVETNLRMLRNLVEAVDEEARDTLTHFTLMQGAKAYGAHLGPFKMPARESDARYMGPNFYYAQMDYLAEFADRAGWHWSILRPQVVFGNAIGSPLNIIAALGVYAAISRELGMPLRFPGGPARANEATDATLLAKATLWAGANPQCNDQVFNIANGDVYYWEMLWPKVAEVFGMEPGHPQPFSLAKTMPGNEGVWDAIVAKHKLKPYGYREIVPSWQMADFLFGYAQRPNAHHLSTIKARQFGFHDCVDTEDMIVDLLRDLQARNILPTPD